jgi:hypothetical protein
VLAGDKRKIRAREGTGRATAETPGTLLDGGITVLLMAELTSRFIVHALHEFYGPAQQIWH